MPSRRMTHLSSTGGSRTHRRSRRFELRRFAGLRTVPCCQASPMGFEPTISCVTGRRALRLLHEDVLFSSSSGGIRTHSIPGSKPRWSANCLPSHVSCVSTQSRSRTCKRSGLSRAALPVGVSGHRRSSPGWTRTIVRLLVRELPSPLGHRTMLFEWTHRELHPDLRLAEPASSCWTMSPSFRERKPWDSNPQAACAATCFQDRLLIQPDDFRLSSCGSWNRTNGLLVQSQASLPTATIPHRSCFQRHTRSTHGSRRAAGAGIEPADSWFKARHHYQQRLPRIGRVPCGSRTRLARLEAWNLCRSAKGTLLCEGGRRGSRTLKAVSLAPAFEAAAVASWLALPFVKLRRQESNLRRSD